jgi:acetylglutamate kinase
VLARVYDLDAAHAAYDVCRQKRPTKLVMLCQKGQIIRRSAS